jgi:hypothetical protein
MSTRLTNAIRNIICDRIIAHRFDKEFNDLIDDEKKLGDEVYKIMYTEDQIKKMNDLGQGFFNYDDDVLLHLDGEWRSLKLTESKPFGYRTERLSFSSNDESKSIGARLRKHFNKKKDLEEKKRKNRREVNSVLASFTTLEKLITAWPEVKSLVEDLKNPAVVVKTNAIMIPIAELNLALKLPPTV